MTTNNQKLTDKLIASLAPQDKMYDVWDSDLKGFVIRVSTTGVKSFRFMYRFNGRQRPYTIGQFGNITTAQARDVAKMKAGEVARGVDPNAEKEAAKELAIAEKKKLITLGEFAEGIYQDWRISNRKNPEETMRRLRTCFKDAFWDIQMVDITHKQVEEWRTVRLKNGIKADTVNRDIADLRTVFTKAVEWKILPVSPLTELKDSKVDKSPNIRFLSEHEEPRLRRALIDRDERIKRDRENGNKFRAARNYQLLPDLSKFIFGDHLSPMILLSINTGLRKSETFGLTWEQINFEIKVLTVYGDVSKSHQTRHIPLNKESLSTLIKWQEQTGNKSGLVFPSETGVAFTDVKKAWYSVLTAAEITNFTWHDMRHHFASMLVMRGVDLYTVKELLGHSSIETTMRYAHLAPSHKAKSVNMLDEQRPTVENKSALIAELSALLNESSTDEARKAYKEIMQRLESI